MPYTPIALARLFAFQGLTAEDVPRSLPHLQTMMKLSRFLLSAAIAASVSGCAVYAVADAAVTVAATGVKVAAKTVGAVADAVIPDGDKD